MTGRNANRHIQRQSGGRLPIRTWFAPGTQPGTVRHAGRIPACTSAADHAAPARRRSRQQRTHPAPGALALAFCSAFPPSASGRKGGRPGILEIRRERMCYGQAAGSLCKRSTSGMASDNGGSIDAAHAGAACWVLAPPVCTKNNRGADCAAPRSELIALRNAQRLWLRLARVRRRRALSLMKPAASFWS